MLMAPVMLRSCSVIEPVPDTLMLPAPVGLPALFENDPPLTVRVPAIAGLPPDVKLPPETVSVAPLLMTTPAMVIDWLVTMLGKLTAGGFA